MHVCVEVAQFSSGRGCELCNQLQLGVSSYGNIACMDIISWVGGREGGRHTEAHVALPVWELPRGCDRRTCRA